MMSVDKLEELRAKYKIEYFVRNGVWYYRKADGTEEFCANRCCKCFNTTDSQMDRFCDDCYAIAPWHDKYHPAQMVLIGIGVLAAIRMVVEYFTS